MFDDMIEMMGRYTPRSKVGTKFDSGFEVRRCTSIAQDDTTYRHDNYVYVVEALLQNLILLHAAA